MFVSRRIIAVVRLCRIGSLIVCYNARSSCLTTQLSVVIILFSIFRMS